MKDSSVLKIIMLYCALAIAAQAQEKTPFKLQVHGYGQVGYSATFPQNGKVGHTFNINKVEMLATAQLTKHWDAGIIIRFNAPVQISELYTGYEIMPELKLRLGQIKTPFGVENQIAPFLNDLISGGSNPTLYFAGIAGDPRYFGTGGRDLGFELSGRLFGGVLSYNAAVMNGNGINRLATISPKVLGAALHVSPRKSGFTGTVSYLGGHAASMKDGKAYTRHRASVGVEWKNKAVHLVTEYMYGSETDVRMPQQGRENPSEGERSAPELINVQAHGAYVTAAIHLPKRTDLLIAADYLNRDSATKNALCTATLGVQHWFRKACRVQFEYQYRHLQGQNPFLAVRSSGHNIAVQVQAAF